MKTGFAEVVRTPSNLSGGAGVIETTRRRAGDRFGSYTAGPDNTAPSAGNIADNVEVLVSLSIKPFYAGRAPGIPGIDPVNFTLSQDAFIPDGCAVPIQIRIGQEVSNPTTFAKSTAGGICVHALGLSSDMLRRLEAGETLKTAYHDWPQLECLLTASPKPS